MHLEWCEDLQESSREGLMMLKFCFEGTEWLFVWSFLSCVTRLRVALPQLLIFVDSNVMQYAFEQYNQEMKRDGCTHLANNVQDAPSVLSNTSRLVTRIYEVA